MKRKLLCRGKSGTGIVRLLPLLLLGLWSVSSAAGALAQNRQLITLDLGRASAGQMLDALKEATDYEFFYRLNDLEDVPVRDYVFADATLEQVMERLTAGTAIQWALRDGTVTISRRAQERRAQQPEGVISGRVTDRGGNPLAGATVVIVGTTRGVVTDSNGEFRIDRIAGGSARVNVSFLGMQTVERTMTVGVRETIELEPDAQHVEEVVVTGLFDRPGESFTGSARTIKGVELQRVGSGNIFQSLRNIDPSLNIMDNLELGSDPNSMPEIELRGSSSFPLGEDELDMRRMYQSNPNQPLFILDGFETSITRIFDLDMQRVESVTILKDAAAKAIYGAKAANGVVVIETRKPAGGELRFTYHGSADITMPDLTSYDLANSMEKLEVELLSGIYGNEQLSMTQAQEELYRQRLNAALSGVDTDWLSKPLRTGVGTRHSVALDISEGSLSIMLDGSYANVAGVMKESGRNTAAGTMSVSYRRADKFLFRNVMSITSNESEDSPYGTFQEYAYMNPYYAPYDEYGDPVKSFGVMQDNPLWNARLNTSLTSNYLNFSNNFYAEYYPVKGMILRLRLGVETQRGESDSFYPGQHTMFAGLTSEEDVLRRGSYTHGVGRSTSFSGDLALQYNKEFGKHLIMSNFVYGMSENNSHELTYMAEGFPSDKMNDMMFARRYAENSAPTGWENIVRDMAFTGVVGYSYDGRYMADFTLRGSASSQYSPRKRWGAFWSLGLAWNVHNEEWARDWTWLEQFKLRASVGSTGNQNIESYAHMVTYKYHTDLFYNGNRGYLAEGEPTSMGAYIMRLANEDLRWEQELATNVGFDARIGRRLTMAFDAYISSVTNKVVDFTLPPSTGYPMVKENIGTVENKGLDFSMSYRLIDRRDFYLNVTGAVSTNVNKIKELSDAMRLFNTEQDRIVEDRNGGGRWKPVLRYVEGGSMTAIWAVPSLGINPRNGQEIYVRPDGSTTYTYSAAYQQIVGDMREKVRGNFGLNGEWKGFGLSVVCRFLGGGDYYNSTLILKVENADVRRNVDRRVFAGRWSEQNRFAPYKRLEPYVDSEGNWVEAPFTQPSSRFVQKRNELDIASVSAYYDIGRLEAVKRLGFNRLRLAFNMNELHKFSSIEVERGTDYPFARTMSFSLTAEF